MRADLDPGMQLAQSGHALLHLALRRTLQVRGWSSQSNNLVVLAAADETALAHLAGRLIAAGCAVELFREPDLDDELTAVAVLGTDTARRALANLPLAGKIMAGAA